MVYRVTKHEVTVRSTAPAPDSAARISTLGQGQNVKVTGKLYFVIGNSILLNDCSFAEAGPNPAIKISAKDLGKEFATADGAPGCQEVLRERAVGRRNCGCG